MRTRTYLLRSASHHRHAHVAVALGAMVGTAVVTGALLVGDSMRASLRETALRRLVGVSHALVAPRFFRTALAEDLAADAEAADSVESITAGLILRGGVTHADSRARVEGVNIIAMPEVAVGRRGALLNRALASDLRASPGDDVLIRLGSADPVSREALMGRRDDAVVRQRLTIERIVSPPEPRVEARAAPPQNEGAPLPSDAPAPSSLRLADFTLQPGHRTPRNVFVSMTDLQRALDRPDRANVVLVFEGDTPSPKTSDRLAARLRDHARLTDYGVRLRLDADHRYIAVESDAFLLDPAVEDAATRVAADLGMSAGGVLTYLANEIAVDNGGEDRTLAYSTVSAIDETEVRASGLELLDGTAAPAPNPGELLLNEWATERLGGRVGDTVRLTYYVTGGQGGLAERSTEFTLAGVVALRGGAADPGFTPPYPGVTDTENLADWDPPFPVDLRRVTDDDERYWDEHRTTPKAFISLVEGRRIWAERRGGDSVGAGDSAGGAEMARSDLTSVRVYVAEDRDIEEAAAAFETALRGALDPAAMGLRFDAVRDRALRAGRGSTDFGGLFIGFSLFLILSAGLLVALLFRLGIERRAGEVGTLLALGFAPRRVGWMLLAEGLVPAGVGGLIGLPASAGYAWLMLAGLRSWWSGAVNAPFLALYVSPLSLVIGFVAGISVATVAILWSLRGLARQPARRLLAGAVAAGSPARRTGTEARPTSGPTGTEARPTAGSTGTEARSSGGATLAVMVIAAALAVLLAVSPALTDAMPAAPTFFCSGASLLVAGLFLINHVIRGGARRKVQKSKSPKVQMPQPGGGRGGWIRRGRLAVVRLGIRNASRHAGRSALTVGLIASATFVIAALQAFRTSPDAAAAGGSGGSGGDARATGTGGFTLFAESVVPLPYDVASPEGRASLGIEPGVLDCDEADGHRGPSHSDQTGGGPSHCVEVFALRLRAGEETSCLNLYDPTDPRILGAPDALIERGGFRFAGTIDAVEEPLPHGRGAVGDGRGAVEDGRGSVSAGGDAEIDESNPWRLLHHRFDDGAVPAIGDAAAVKWQLHSGIGQDVLIFDERGRQVALRFVALLEGSALQSELVISERRFTQLFPSIDGDGFLMIAAPAGDSRRITESLERSLEDFGVDVFSPTERLADYLAVQNTYLLTFQTLGGFGLVLGTIGMGAVLLRNVWERRGELALMRALGFSRVALATMVLAENALLVLLGLLAGVVPSALAVAPHLVSDPGRIPLGSIGLTLAGVLLVGLIAGVVAVVPTLRAPLLPGLRRE